MSDNPQLRPRYTGLPSFFRLPYIEEPEALAPEARPEIGIIGVPYDGGVTNRPGTRHGPREVRNQSSLIRRVNAATGVGPFDARRVADIGDTWVERPFALEGAHDEIRKDFARIHGAGIRPLSVGGDHSMTLPILRAVAAERPLALVQIDAHADTGDNYLGSRFHHGAPFKIATDEGLILPQKTVQIGIRGSVATPDFWAFSAASGMRVIPIEEVEARGWQAVMDEALAIVGDAPAYVSFDIDALDPSVAPGTGTPVCGGLSTWQAREIIRRLGTAGGTPVNVVGMDVVEVSPPYDHAEITALAGATIALALVCLYAEGASARGAAA
ncbi:MAG: agmatinase [Pseudomonadota bacterium]